MVNKRMMFIYGLILVLLTACGQKEIETVYDQLEKAVQAEESFGRQQQLLTTAEEKDHERFAEIVSIGMREKGKVLALADEVLSSLDERANLLEIERESIEASMEQFRQSEKQIKKLNEPLNEQLISLHELMEKRYETYHLLYDTYKDALSKDQALFTTLKSDNIRLNELQAQIDEVNEAYEEVNTQRERFNELTIQYNEEKRSFYKEAGLTVHYEQ